MDNDLAKTLVLSTAGFVVGEVFHPITRNVENRIPDNTLLFVGGLGLLVPNTTVNKFSLSLFFDDLSELWRRSLREQKQIC